MEKPQLQYYINFFPIGSQLDKYVSFRNYEGEIRPA